MRERELKHLDTQEAVDATASLPMRERELKPEQVNHLRTSMMSLPMRERELKPVDAKTRTVSYGRSPCGSVN